MVWTDSHDSGYGHVAVSRGHRRKRSDFTKVANYLSSWVNVGFAALWSKLREVMIRRI
jgi:hypothetical protein